MKRIILILVFAALGGGAFGQTILKTWTLDLSTVSASATDSVLYCAANEDYNNVAFETEQIGIARECGDSIITRIGWSSTTTGFNEYSSETFPYELDAADTSYANGVYGLRKADHGGNGADCVIYYAFQIDFNGSTCRSGTIKNNLI